MKLDHRIKAMCERTVAQDDWPKNMFEMAEFILSLEQPTGNIRHMNEQQAVCMKGAMTVECVAEWLASLPEEFRKASFESVIGGFPLNLKRIVAYRFKDGSGVGVTTNSMGTHLPMDDSLTWVHVLRAGEATRLKDYSKSFSP